MPPNPDQTPSAKVPRLLRRAVAGRRPPAAPEGAGGRRAPGPRPEVVEERTNVGPEFDAIVTRAKRNQKPLGVDPDYDLVREHFDHHHFMLQAEQAQELPLFDPIRVFLANGAAAVNSPHPDFSMRNYLQRYPEKAEEPGISPYVEWLRRGRSAGEIADPGLGIEPMARVLDLTPQEIVDELVTVRADVLERLRTGKLGEMFAKAAEVEPLVGAVWPETARLRLPPISTEFVAGQVAAVHACHQQVGLRRARVVIVTDRPRAETVRRAEGHLAAAMAAVVAPEEIVVIYTDDSGTRPDLRFPPGVREADFASVSQGLPAEHQELGLVSLLRSFQADAIVNVDSSLLYRALGPYGRALASSERIFLYVRAKEQRPQGNWDGWGLRWLHTGADFAAGFIVESEAVRAELAEHFQMGESDTARLQVLGPPVDPGIAEAVPASRSAGGRPLVVWASGESPRQARLPLALEIARQMPDVDFRFFGERVRSALRGSEVPDNVRVERQYADVARLDLSAADVWLYTTVPYGVPDLLLDVAMTGVPTVASLVGGVAEVITADDAWPVVDVDEPAAYVRALREVLADPEAARARARSLRERLERERWPEAYAERLAAMLLPSGEGAR